MKEKMKVYEHWHLRDWVAEAPVLGMVRNIV
jgi:hypothetical protein